MQSKTTTTVSTNELYHSETTSTPITYARCLEAIIGYTQRLHSTNDDCSRGMATELANVTDNRIQLHLHKQVLSESLMIPWIAGQQGFLMLWNNVVYGSLQALLGTEPHPLPLPFVQCERLAKDCAWCLHLLESEIRLQQPQMQREVEAIRKVAYLRACEYKVLSLMVQGLSTSAIATTLHLSKRTIETHQRNMYQALDVHSQREAICVGMNAGMPYKK